MSGQFSVFLGWTSTKRWIKCLAHQTIGFGKKNIWESNRDCISYPSATIEHVLGFSKETRKLFWISDRSRFVEFVLFDLILYVPSTIFQLNRDRSSWVEPVLSWNKCVLLKDHNAVRLEHSVSSQNLLRINQGTVLYFYTVCILNKTITVF